MEEEEKKEVVETVAVETKKIEKGFLKFLEIKEKNKFDIVENYSIFLIVIGAVILSLGMGLTIITTKGIPAILAMSGAFISFLFTIVLIFTWLAKEIFGE